MYLLELVYGLFMHMYKWNVTKTNCCAHFNVTAKSNVIRKDLMWLAKIMLLRKKEKTLYICPTRVLYSTSLSTDSCVSPSQHPPGLGRPHQADRLWAQQGVHIWREEDVLLLRHCGVHGTRGCQQERSQHCCWLVVLRCAHGAFTCRESVLIKEVQ